MNASKTVTIYYDRDCGFCRFLMAEVLRWDQSRRRLQPLAIQDASENSALAGMAESERMASWHLEHADGTLVSAGAALPVVLSIVDKHRLIASAFRRYPQLTERGYRWVTAHRAALGKVTRHWASLRGVPYPPVITDGDGDASTCSIA
jgi:predicted DCC family thiol-disulfide oxidoreductase YuxK